MGGGPPARRGGSGAVEGDRAHPAQAGGGALVGRAQLLEHGGGIGDDAAAEGGDAVGEEEGGDGRAGTDEEDVGVRAAEAEDVSEDAVDQGGAPDGDDVPFGEDL